MNGVEPVERTSGPIGVASPSGRTVPKRTGMAGMTLPRGSQPAATKHSNVPLESIALDGWK